MTLTLLIPRLFDPRNRSLRGSAWIFQTPFQIVSVRDGYFAPLVNDSQTVLVTADKDLAVAARAENLRVWSAMEEDPPQ